MANPWRTYHVTDISTTVFSRWKAAVVEGSLGLDGPILSCFLDLISPFKDSFTRYTCLLVIADCRTVRMTIIVFLVDTSASMNQRTYIGTTILDTAKGAVETFMKVNVWFPYVKLSVFRRISVLCCCINWNLWYFRLDREIQTADGIVTCCWHSTNRRRTSEWVVFRLYFVDFVTDKWSIRCMDVCARFVCCSYRCLQAVVTVTTKISRELILPSALRHFCLYSGLRPALTQSIIARSGNEAGWWCILPLELFFICPVCGVPQSYMVESASIILSIQSV